jgi:hypothetical protein
MTPRYASNIPTTPGFPPGNHEQLHSLFTQEETSNPLSQIHSTGILPDVYLFVTGVSFGSTH